MSKSKLLQYLSLVFILLLTTCSNEIENFKDSVLLTYGDDCDIEYSLTKDGWHILNLTSKEFMVMYDYPSKINATIRWKKFENSDLAVLYFTNYLQKQYSKILLYETPAHRRVRE